MDAPDLANGTCSGSPIARRRFFSRIVTPGALAIPAIGVAVWLLFIPSAGETIQRMLADPNWAFATTLLGILLLYVECLVPGLVLPGALGAAGVLLGGTSLFLAPLQSSGLALLILCPALFALEAKRPLAIRGAYGTAATVALAVGAMVLVAPHGSAPRIAPTVAMGSALVFGTITQALLSLAVRAHYNKRVSAYEDPGAIALEPINPHGRVRLDGEIWNAISAMPIPRGAQVKVHAIRDLTLHVEPIPALLSPTQNEPGAIGTRMEGKMPDEKAGINE